MLKTSTMKPFDKGATYLILGCNIGPDETVPDETV